MPDTGAPWNIPYVAGTDLVSDWPTDSQALANAIADGLDAAGNAGIGSNVVQAVKTNSFSTTSTSFVDVTDLEVTITPSSATAKVLLIFSVNLGGSVTDNLDTYIQIDRGGTALMTGARGTGLWWGHNRTIETKAGGYVDSPASASPVTYKIQVKRLASGTAYINTNNSGWDVASSLIAIEVAA